MMPRSRALVATLLAVAPFACSDKASAPSHLETTTAALTPSPGETEAWVPRPFYQGVSPQLTYDEARKELVIFGGTNISSSSLDQTWVWNGSMQLRTPKTSPPGRSTAAMTYDSDRKLVVLHGGYTSVGYASDTWTWNGTDWSEVVTPQSPPLRMQPSITYDPVRKVVLLAGGYLNGLLRDTWSFDGKTWRDETAGKAQLPGSYFSNMMFFDKKEKAPTLLVPLGFFGCSTVAIWRYRAAGWTRESAEGTGPTVCPTAGGFDTSRNQVLMFGVEVVANVAKNNKIWAYDGGWTEIPASAPPILGRYSSDTAAFGDGELFVTNGQESTGVRIHALQHWKGTTWQIDETSRIPSLRRYPSVTSWKNGSIFFFGGFADGAPRDTWLFDGKDWKLQNTVIAPLGRGRAFAAFDEKRSEVILFGGTKEYGNTFHDTWTWNGSDWSAETPSVGPGDVTSGGGLVYDPVRDRAFLFDAGGSGGAAAKLWSWNGATRQWTFVSVANGPTASAYPSFAFDRARNVSVLFGGNYRDDTWTWDGSQWTRLAPKNRPAGRQGASFAWDALHERLVLFGGYATGNVAMNDVWTWDGQDWTSLVNTNTKSPPTERAFASFVALGNTGNMLLFGGVTNTGAGSDYWTFRTRGGACTTDAACASGSCVDGACCEQSACGSCETCAGVDRGVCSPVRNAEDPDTCNAKSGKRCDQNGACIGGISARCTQNAECASGFCVDGVCCSTSCDLPCEACAAAKKLVPSDDGRCGPAKVGDNPGGRCADGATCNASGSCETRTQAVCRNERTLDLGQGQTQECAPYRCANNTCTKSCKTYSDCAFPATCSPTGRCESREAVLDAGGCTLAAPTPGAPSPFWGTLVALGFLRRRRARP